MTARAADLGTLLRPLGWAGAAGAAAVAGAGAVTSPQLALLAVGGVVLLLLLAYPAGAAVLAVAVLPFPNDLVPGGALELSASDLLLLVALTGWAVQALLGATRERGAVRAPAAVRVLWPSLGVFGIAAVLSFVAHPTVDGVVAIVQRTELVLGALLLGALLVRAGRLHEALEGYVLVSLVLSLGALLQSVDDNILGVQKNPAGGYIATALIVVLVLRPGRRWIVYAPVLAAGLVSTQSRGALIGLAVAALVTVAVVRYGERAKTVGVVAASAVFAYGAYLSLPDDARRRLVNLGGVGDFAVRYREEFQADALDVFRSNPWLGTGVGNYVGGFRQPGITDPHNVVYLALAEGGVVLLGGFLLLVIATLWVAFRSISSTRLATVALAVQLSTVVHALGDVYWVRGTPVMGFLLVGATLAVVAHDRLGDARVAGWTRSRHSAAKGLASSSAGRPATQLIASVRGR